MSAGRSASSPTFRDQSSGLAPLPRARSRSQPGDVFVLDSKPDARLRRSGCICRTPKSSPPSSPATACCSTTARSGSAVTEATRAKATVRWRPVARLSDRKGVSVPGLDDRFRRADREGPRPISKPRSMPEVDWVALSFVQRPEDLAEVTEDRARPRRR